MMGECDKVYSSYYLAKIIFKTIQGSRLTVRSWRRKKGGGREAPEERPTCALLGAAGPLAMHPQLAAKVLLPELSEPDVPAVVGQRTAPEVSVEGWGQKESGVRARAASRHGGRPGAFPPHRPLTPSWGGW